ncbi:unnamed protein product [Arctia plantaginis]|uniref:Uncharacterized protein n=1 Tax=Arctia plantaginis TaxID=874455 RepID=A0A8S1BIE5_ARCPL|nr:unnamed protein product [Arctia plantaginis]
MSKNVKKNCGASSVNDATENLDEANFYFKSCFELHNDLFRNLCWHGSKKNRVKVALKSTRFAEACEAAMNLNKDGMEKPTLDKFSTAMTKAIKNVKEGYHRKRAAVNELEEQPPHRRARVLLPRNNPAIVVEQPPHQDDNYEDVDPFRQEQQAPANVEEENEDAEDDPTGEDQHEDETQYEEQQEYQQEKQPEEQDYERNEINLNALHYVDNEE